MTRTSFAKLGLAVGIGLIPGCGDDAPGAGDGTTTGLASSDDTGPMTTSGSAGASTTSGSDTGLESSTSSSTEPEPEPETDTDPDTGGPSVSNIEKAQLLISAFESGDAAALDVVSDDMYIQHNLAFPDGKEALAGLLTGVPTGFTTVNHRTFADGDIVFMHNEFGGAWNGGTPQATFDVFRFEDGLIVEHWDNLADLQDDGDGTTQLDGPTEATNLRDTEDNRAAVELMLQDLFIDGQWSTIGDYFNLEGYIQHAVGAGADSAGLQALVATLPDGTPFFSSVEFVYAQGDMVLSMSEGFPAEDTGLADAYYDLWRIEDGLVIEHWDIIQTIPAMEDWANDNGKW